MVRKVAAACLLLVLGLGCAAPTTGAPTASASVQVVVTHDHYLKLTVDMSYQDVLALLGLEGKEVSRETVFGQELVAYTWTNADGSSIAVTFLGGKLNSKFHRGLAPEPEASGPTPEWLTNASASPEVVASPSPTSAPLLVAPSPSPAAQASHMGECWVNGYTRKNGTKVNGYWRRCP